MSDRAKALIVVLDSDLSEEDTQATCEALKHFRGVIEVVPHIHDIGDVIAESRAQHKMATKIYEFLKNWRS
jgi:hypothetical protein